MGLEDLIALTRDALMLSVSVSLPVVGAVAVVGLLVSLLQASMQLQEQGVGQVLRLVTALAVLGVMGSWMGTQILHFTLKAFASS